MKLRENNDPLGPARRVEGEAVQLIDRVLVVLGKPVLRGRESVFLFERYIRRSKWKPNEPLGDFCRGTRGGMF